MSAVQVTRSASLVQVTATRPQVAVGTPSIVSASAVPFTPAGSIAATNVQAAIAELDAEKQPLDAELSALAALTSAADQLPYFTGLGTAALTTLTAFGRSLIAAADAPAAKVVLGLGLLASSVSGNTATITGALTGARNYTLPDASMTFAGLEVANVFTSTQTVPDGSGAPGIRTTSEAHGFGRGTATSLRLYAAGTRAFDIGYSGSASFAIFGAASAGDVGFFHQQADGSVQLCGSTGATVGGQVRLYGQSHATKANRVEFTSGNTVRAYIDGTDGGLVFANGTAASPGIRTTDNHGQYRASATGLGLAVAGVSSAIISAPAAGYGGGLQLKTVADADYTYIWGDRTNAEMRISAGSSSVNGGHVRLYASTHANASTGRLYGDATLCLTWASAGLTAGVNLTLPNGTPAAPACRTTTYAHGFYSASAATLGLAAAGAQALVIGGPGGTFGAYAYFNTPSASEYSSLYNNRSDTYMGISGGTGPANSGVVRLYGSTHATKPDTVELCNGGSVVKIAINATGIGFFAAAPVAKPTVTGSRGANAALASLLTALAGLGLLTDSSS